MDPHSPDLQFRNLPLGGVAKLPKGQQGMRGEGTSGPTRPSPHKRIPPQMLFVSDALGQAFELVQGNVEGLLGAVGGGAGIAEYCAAVL